MKPIYECEWCSFRGTADVVESHERNCKYNPKNIEIEEKRSWIQKHCPHCQMRAPDYMTYIGCKLKHGWDDDCEQTSDCLQYCEGEDVWNRI